MLKNRGAFPGPPPLAQPTTDAADAQPGGNLAPPVGKRASRAALTPNRKQKEIAKEESSLENPPGSFNLS